MNDYKFGSRWEDPKNPKLRIRCDAQKVRGKSNKQIKCAKVSRRINRKSTNRRY